MQDRGQMTGQKMFAAIVSPELLYRKDGKDHRGSSPVPAALVVLLVDVDGGRTMLGGGRRFRPRIGHIIWVETGNAPLLWRRQVKNDG